MVRSVVGFIFIIFGRKHTNMVSVLFLEKKLPLVENLLSCYGFVKNLYKHHYCCVIVFVKKHKSLVAENLRFVALKGRHTIIELRTICFLKENMST